MITIFIGCGKMASGNNVIRVPTNLVEMIDKTSVRILAI